MWYHYFPFPDRGKEQQISKDVEKESPKESYPISSSRSVFPYAAAICRPNHSDTLTLGSLRVSRSGLFLRRPLAVLLSPS